MQLITNEHGMPWITRETWEVMGAKNVYIIKAQWWNIHNFLIFWHFVTIFFLISTRQSNIFSIFLPLIYLNNFCQTYYFGMLTTHKEVVSNEVGSKNNIYPCINHLLTYLIIYFLIYLLIYEIYFLQNWLPRSNQIRTQLKFIYN
jgi:hypothetical protein